jgi:hypothetical protein
MIHPGGKRGDKKSLPRIPPLIYSLIYDSKISFKSIFIYIKFSFFLGKRSWL